VIQVCRTQRFSDKLSVIRSFDPQCADLVEQEIARSGKGLKPEMLDGRADIRAIEISDLQG
jgi:hypothetical protein